MTDLYRMARRVSGGRLVLWREVLDELVGMRRELILPGIAAIVIIVILNLPWWPAYERGLFTGAFVTTCIWIMSWVLWVMSGRGLRLNGVMAEDVTNDVLRKHPRALATLSSYKREFGDIDNVLVTGSGVYAIEVKWRQKAPSRWWLKNEADHLQAAVEELRAQLERLGICDVWIRGVLLIRGPGSDTVQTQLLDVGTGRRVRVVTSTGLAAWLDGQDGAQIPPATAESLINDLRLANAALEEQVNAGPVLRWLARVR